MEEVFLPAGLTIGPSRVDLALSDSFSCPEPDKDKITLAEAVPHKQVQTDEFVLKANHLVLAGTAKSIHVLNDMATYVEGCSSIGRLGLQVQNAGIHGQITLELENQSGFPIVLKIRSPDLSDCVCTNEPVYRKIVLWKIWQTKRSDCQSTRSESKIFISLFFSQGTSALRLAFQLYWLRYFVVTALKLHLIGKEIYGKGKIL